MDHHYVPQFLLQPWAVGTPDGRLEAFRVDLPDIPSKRLKPRATGFEPDLYALTKPVVAGMEQQAIEKNLLRIVDNSGAIARRKLDLEGLQNLTSQQRIDWVRFLMSLRVRRPRIVERLRREGSEMLRKHLAADPHEYDSMRKDGDEPTLEEWAEARFPGIVENIGLSMFSKFVVNPKIGNKILNSRWSIFDITQSAREFLLADDPLIFVGDIDQPNLILALPITPTKLFMITKRVVNRLDQKIFIELINGQSVLNASVRLYARDAKPRRFILNRMRLRE